MALQNTSERKFLDVVQSVSGRAWCARLSPAQLAQAEAISQNHDDISDHLSRIIASRGVTNEDAEAFLAPSIRELLPDPSNFTQMDQAAQCLLAAILNGTSIAIFGDYDVDGACSSAILWRFLNAFGLDAEIYIPDRIFEGYGPNISAIEELYAKGHRLLVTVDCGSTSIEPLQRAQELGMQVVILDHHQLGVNLPPADAHVNPNRQDDLSGQGHLCAAGVVFLACVATLRDLRKTAPKNVPASLDLMMLLDLVALATVCDVVPLLGVNRAFVRRGLEIMQMQKNIGLNELARVARLDGPPTPYHLGFILGPRINAGGRIGDAALGARLLTLNDELEAADIAEQLEMLNKERQAIEATMLEEAMAEAQVEMEAAAPPQIIVTQNENWHPGVVGLLASRLKERFRQPAIAIAFDPSGKGSGSCRSVAGVDIGAIVRGAVEKGVLLKGGGHAMAAGLTIEKSKLGELRSYLEEEASKQLSSGITDDGLEVDAALTASGANVVMIDDIEKAGPFGASAPQPVFAFPAHFIRNARIVGANHISLTLTSGDGASLNAIAFRAHGTELGDILMRPPGPLHIVGSLSKNHWQGRVSAQLRIVDAALPQTK